MPIKWTSWPTLGLVIVLLAIISDDSCAKKEVITCSSLNPEQSSWKEPILYEIGPGGKNSGNMTLQCLSNNTNLSLQWYRCKNFYNCKQDKIKKKLSKKCSLLRSTWTNTSSIPASITDITPPDHYEGGCVVIKYLESDSTSRSTTDESYQTVRYEFTDACGTPLPTDRVLQRFCSISQKAECKLSPPTGLDVRQVTLTMDAYPEVSIKWDQHPLNETHFYGYSLFLLKDLHYVEELCLTTKYNNSELAKTSFHTKAGQNYANLSNILAKPLEFSRNYTLNLFALPNSTKASVSFEILSVQTMCQKYEQEHNETPLHCYMVENLNLHENCETKIVNITWTLPKDLPREKFQNYSVFTLETDSLVKEQNIPYNENYHLINTSVTPIYIYTIHVQLVDSNGHRAHGAFATKKHCPTPPPTSLPTNSTSTATTETPQPFMLAIVIISSMGLLVVALVSGF